MSILPEDFWYPWYPIKYGDATAAFTLEQDGLYRRLLDAYYIGGGAGLPADRNALARIAGISRADYDRVVLPSDDAQTMRAASENDAWRIGSASVWHEGADGRLYNRRADIVIENIEKREKRQSDGAKNAAAARWNKQKGLVAPRIASASSPQRSRNAERSVSAMRNDATGEDRTRQESYLPESSSMDTARGIKLPEKERSPDGSLDDDDKNLKGSKIVDPDILPSLVERTERALEWIPASASRRDHAEATRWVRAAAEVGIAPQALPGLVAEVVRVVRAKVNRPIRTFGYLGEEVGKAIKRHGKIAGVVSDPGETLGETEARIKRELGVSEPEPVNGPISPELAAVLAANRARGNGRDPDPPNTASETTNTSDDEMI